MTGIKKTMEIIRTELSGWMIDNGISYGHAEDAFAKIENALNAEKREKESIDGFHVGDKVRVVKIVRRGGNGPRELPVPDDIKGKIGTLHPCMFHDGMSEFDVVFEDGKRTDVLTWEIEHA